MHKQIWNGVGTLKTYKDFDLNIYRKEIIQIGKEKKAGLTEEEVENYLMELIENGKDTLESKVHCLTCGVGFRLNALEHDCKEEDIWLFQYVKNSVKNKDITAGYLQKLKDKYPMQEGIMYLFRGINFKTKQQYEAFVANAKTGYFTFDTITSWSKSFEYAQKFACWTQKGTKDDDSNRLEELNQMAFEKANITGYKGVVIALRPVSNKVLCDISEEHIGNMNEKEVIMLHGTYEIEIVKTIDKEFGSTIWNKEEFYIC